MTRMDTPHAQENSQLLAPYIAERNELAHRTLTAMLAGRHTEAGQLLASYQLAAMAVDAGEQICHWFDDADPIEPD